MFDDYHSVKCYLFFVSSKLLYLPFWGVCYFPSTIVNSVSFVSHGYAHISRNAPIEILIETISYQLFVVLLVCPDSYLIVMDRRDFKPLLWIFLWKTKNLIEVSLGVFWSMCTHPWLGSSRNVLGIGNCISLNCWSLGALEFVPLKQ